ncbi:MAG: hypothetical protein E6Q89_03060 [Bacteroidia bacterium]|nr:MAG: hypothetical protein E6Q89_03060 [Bacteroidia bacterium]
MKFLFLWVEKLYNTIRGNGLFIAIAVFFPFVIYQLDAGREILYFLNNDESGLNLSLIIFSFFMLSLSLWCIPAWSIKLFHQVTAIDLNEPEIHRSVSDNYYGYTSYKAIDRSENLIREQFAVRYIALIPWFLFLITFLIVFYSYKSKFFLYLLALPVLIFVSIYLIDYIIGKKKHHIEEVRSRLIKRFKSKRVFVTVVLLCFLMFFMAPLLQVPGKEGSLSIFTMYPYLYLAYFYLGMLLMYLFMKFFDYETGRNKGFSLQKNQTREESSNSEKNEFSNNDEALEKEQRENQKNQKTELNSLANKEVDQEDEYKASLRIHGFVCGITFAFFALFVYLNFNFKLNAINPIVVCIMISASAIVGIELFFTSQILISKLVSNQDAPNESVYGFRLKVYKYCLLGLVFGICFFYFFKSFNQSLIRVEPVEKYEKGDYAQEQIGDYFDQWWKSNGFDKSAEPVNVFLISGQGGGSRAGAWFLLNMLKRENMVKYRNEKEKADLTKCLSKTKNKIEADQIRERIAYLESDNFYKHIFSISTVSGSSSGAQMYMAFHQLDEYNADIKDSTKIVKEIYTQNYLSSGLFGLLISDFTFDAVWDFFTGERRDRNYAFQNEEKNLFKKAYLKSHSLSVIKDEKNEKLAGKSQKNIPEISKDEVVQEIERKIDLFFDGDFMSIYKQNYTNPLLFLNCTVVDDGTRGYFSPVKTDSISYAKNLYGDFRDCHASDNKALPMVTCVNQSQAFPLMNSYNYLHGSGRLGDGGFYENSGNETTLEIYDFLKNHTQKYSQKYAGKLNLICINLINSKIKNRKNSEYKQPSFLNTVVSLASNPFYGHQYVAVQNLKKRMKKDGAFSNYIELKPDHDYTLTRMLSTKTFADLSKANKFINNEYMHTIGSFFSKNPLLTCDKQPDNEGVIYIQYNLSNIDIVKIERIKNTLRKANFDVKPAEKISFSFNNSIRYYHTDDLAKATDIQNFLKDRNFKVEYFGNAYSGIPKGQIEVWINN